MNYLLKDSDMKKLKFPFFKIPYLSTKKDYSTFLRLDFFSYIIFMNIKFISFINIDKYLSNSKKIHICHSWKVKSKHNEEWKDIGRTEYLIDSSLYNENSIVAVNKFYELVSNNKRDYFYSEIEAYYSIINELTGYISHDDLIVAAYSPYINKWISLIPTDQFRTFTRRKQVIMYLKGMINFKGN